MSVVIKGDSNVNLDFTTGGRITGDFSNATLANRVYAQSTTTNATTSFGVLPNGTGASSAYNAFASSDPTNTSFVQLRVGTDTADVRLTSGISGTGTYQPMTFYTGGSERVRIDTSGNVGIGTSSPGAKLEIGALGVFRMQTGSTVFNTTPTAGAVDTLVWNTSNAGSGFAWNTNSTERVRITPAGDVGIGTSSPSWMVSVRKDSASASTGQYPVVQVNNANASGYAGLYLNDSTALAGLETRRDTAHLGMYAGGSERARITSAGNLQVGTSGSPVFEVSFPSNSHRKGAWVQHDTAQPYGYVDYYYGAFRAGYILWNNTGLSLTSLSDVRMKKNIQDADSSLSVLSSLRVRQFDWKTTDKHQNFGFIAQELNEVFPEAVGAMVDETLMWGIDNSKLVPVLVKAIQEQQAIIESLTARITALEAK